jgi:hypothetical protein
MKTGHQRSVEQPSEIVWIVMVDSQSDGDEVIARNNSPELCALSNELEMAQIKAICNWKSKLCVQFQLIQVFGLFSGYFLELQDL